MEHTVGNGQPCGQRDTEMVRRQDRIASADRRSAAVGDVLSGQVRLRDSEGNQYEAHAGSNYYYLNQQQSRLESNRSNAVLGTDISVPVSSGSIDLRPLEVIRSPGQLYLPPAAAAGIETPTEAVFNAMLQRRSVPWSCASRSAMLRTQSPFIGWPTMLASSPGDAESYVAIRLSCEPPTRACKTARRPAGEISVTRKSPT